MMDSGNIKHAQKLLKGCENFISTCVPEHFIHQLCCLFTINNNLAQLANRNGDVPLSIHYLEKAIEACLDNRIENKDEMPITETYLNIANANCFIEKYD